VRSGSPRFGGPEKSGGGASKGACKREEQMNTLERCTWGIRGGSVKQSGAVVHAPGRRGPNSSTGVAGRGSEAGGRVW